MADLNCIYIPRISTLITDDAIAQELEWRGVGHVSRVDFVPITKRPGYGEGVDTVVRSAFVHLSVCFVTELTRQIIHGSHTGTGPHIYPSNSRDYWILLKANNPIPETTMTTAQIVHNCHLLEERIDAQEQTIRQLQETLDRVCKLVGAQRDDSEFYRLCKLVGASQEPEFYCEDQQGKLHRHAQVTPDLTEVSDVEYESDLDYDMDIWERDDTSSVTHGSVPALEKISVGSERSHVSCDLCGNE